MEKTQSENKNFIKKALLWVIQGAIVGIGAILPGVSGGSLMYAFGIYNQILEVLSNPIAGIKKYWKMLCFVGIGGAVGFVGFAGITEMLLANFESIVICAFIGLIIGTLPGLWKEAGEKGRGKVSILAMIMCFVVITALFTYIRFATEAPSDVVLASSETAVSQKTMIPQNIFGWILCGLIWGLGFVVPGLSSSNLLMFFGIYEILLRGIKSLDFSVVIPFGLAVLAVFLLLSKVMKLVFEKFHSIASHCILGFVVGTTLVILPSFNMPWWEILICIVLMIAFAVASYFFSLWCDKVKKIGEEQPAE